MLLGSLSGPLFAVFLVGASLPFAHARVRAVDVIVAMLYEDRSFTASSYAVDKLLVSDLSVFSLINRY